MPTAEYFEVQTTYSIYYRTKEPVPIEEIIESLRSIERLLKRTPKIIERAFEGIEVSDVEVYVESLHSGSLTEDFIVKYVFRGRENYDKAKEVWDTMLQDNTALRTAVALGVGGLITYGAMQVIGPGAPSQHIEAYNNTIINIGGKVDLKGEDVQAIISSMKDKKAIAKEAIGAARPAKSDPDASIEMSGIKALTMDKGVLSEIPDEYEPPQPGELENEKRDVRVLIYASDRDKTDSNWAGLVPGYVDKRVPFSLGEDIDPKDLHGKTSIKADVRITLRMDGRSKSYKPVHVEIIEVKPDEGGQ